MDRRSFLKTLGLGAVALTVPKPLSIISAKMEDLTRPPLHVGYHEAQPAEPCGEGGAYYLHEMGVRVLPGLTCPQYADYAENWCLSIFLRKKGERGRGINYLTMQTGYMPDPSHMVKRLYEDGKLHSVPDFYTATLALVLKPDDVMEFWFSPLSALSNTEPPSHPLPKIQVVLRGVRTYTSTPRTGKEYVQGKAITHWHCGDVEKVLLDRAKAIELGLVSPATMEFDAG